RPPPGPRRRPGPRFLADDGGSDAAERSRPPLYDQEEAEPGDTERQERHDDEPYDDEPYDDYDDDLDDRDYVELRRESSRGRRVLTVVLVVVVVIALAVGGAFVWVQRQIDPPGEPGEAQEVEVPQGSTADDIGRLLADEGIIASDMVWGWYLRINGGGPFQAGLYELSPNSAMADVIRTLEAGPRPPEERSFTIPEAFTLPEILDRLADEELGLGFDRATLQQIVDSGEVTSSVLGPVPSFEGLLFPDTYRVAEDADEGAVLRQMVAQLDAVLTELDVASAEERFNLTPYEVLIVASLIEEETKVDAERPMVARVIYNRLSQGIPLGIDATSRYEAELAGRSRDDIDFTSDSPYNTRRTQGLIPTPIASPGRASIEAALNPAEGPWTFYVLEDAEGNHFFTDSNSEFLAAKERCRLAGLGCG
ncbi:MAG: endolytic transglycosylase MltG, partial [Acidimicrobiales bacterium]